MKTIVSNFALVLTILLLYCCSNSPKKIEEAYMTPEDLYSGAVEIKGEKLPNELYAKPFFKGFIAPDGFLGYIRADNKKLVHLLDASTSEFIASEGTNGRGPNELLLAHAMDYNPQTGSFFLHDIMRSVVVQFGYDNGKIINKGPINLEQRGQGCITEELQTISDSLFVIRVNDIAPPYSCYLSIVNSRNEVLDSLQVFEIEDDRINHSKVRVIDASMRLSPNRKNLFVCNSRYNHITKYSIENNKLHKLKGKTFLKPEYTTKRGKLIMDSKHIVWKGEIFTSEKYLYVVSDPESWGDFLSRLDRSRSSGDKMDEFAGHSYILVFDHDLNFIASYKCDDSFKWITIAPDGKTIYASTFLDGCYLTKYLLTGLL